MFYGVLTLIAYTFNEQQITEVEEECSKSDYVLNMSPHIIRYK